MHIILMAVVAGVLIVIFIAMQAQKLGTEEHEPIMREKLRKALDSADSDRGQAVSRIVREEAGKMIDEIKKEYAAKVEEKTREVEEVQKQYREIQHEYERVEKNFHKVFAEKKQTEAVVRSITEGLVVVNKKGEVLLMNPSAEKLLGVQREKKIGRSIMDSVPEEVLVSLSREAPDGKEKVIEMNGKDEMKKVIRSSSAVIQNEDGETVGMVNILTDVTKQKQLDEMKARFVSNVTHEFRTPLVAMKKATEILLSPAAGSLNETQSNFVQIISRNLGNLSRLVEDMLDIAEIDAGKMKVRPALSRLDRTIEDACGALETWAATKGIAIAREHSPQPLEFLYDPDKITQVLNNFLSNAIKFTPAGGTITVTARPGADGASAEVTVRDTGCGIAKENLPKLFQRFEQFGSQAGINGTGLGLSITKEIVERHGGQVSVDSEPGKGTAFTFTLPFNPPIQEAAPSHG